EAGGGLPGPPGKTTAGDGGESPKAHLRLGRAALLGDGDEPAPDGLRGIRFTDQREAREHPEEVAHPHFRLQRIARGQDLPPLGGQRFAAQTIEESKRLAAWEQWAWAPPGVARSLPGLGCPCHHHLLD